MAKILTIITAGVALIVILLSFKLKIITGLDYQYHNLWLHPTGYDYFLCYKGLAEDFLSTVTVVFFLYVMQYVCVNLIYIKTKVKSIAASAIFKNHKWIKTICVVLSMALILGTLQSMICKIKVESFLLSDRYNELSALYYVNQYGRLREAVRNWMSIAVVLELLVFCFACFMLRLSKSDCNENQKIIQRQILS